MKIGLLFGSFNPPHYGHIMLGEEVKKSVDEAWYIPAYQNPAKKDKAVDIDIRIEMLRSVGLTVSDIEKELGEEPHYTYDVLVALRERHPEHQFFVACGEDIKPEHWKNGKKLVKEFGIIRLPRVLGLSSTQLRDALQEGKSLQGLCPPEIEEIIRSRGLYSL